MSSTTVAEFAAELKKSPDQLLEQLKSAGVAKSAASDALSETVCALPEVTAVEMVEVAEPPGFTDAEVGLADSEKSFVNFSVVSPRGPKLTLDCFGGQSANSSRSMRSWRSSLPSGVPFTPTGT